MNRTAAKHRNPEVRRKTIQHRPLRGVYKPNSEKHKNNQVRAIKVQHGHTIKALPMGRVYIKLTGQQ
jgi:hypothetical protein